MVRNALRLAERGLAIRLRIAGGQVRPQFVAEPLEGDEVTDVDGLRVFVAAKIVEQYGDVVIDATEEHGNLVVRSA